MSDVGRTRDGWVERRVERSEQEAADPSDERADAAPDQGTHRASGQQPDPGPPGGSAERHRPTTSPTNAAFLLAFGLVARGRVALS